MARSASSNADPVGASFSTEATYAWENRAGFVALIPLILNSPNTSYDPLYATLAASVAASSGQAQVVFQLPSTLDPSTVTSVTISLVPIGGVP
jgi:hypothetical protein